MTRLNLKGCPDCLIISAIVGIVICAGLYILYTQVSGSCAIPPRDSNVEVVVSACRNPHLYSVSPDGKYLLYGTKSDGIRLRDLTTGTEEGLSKGGRVWLSDQWLLQEYQFGNKRQFYVFDVTDRTQTSLQWANDLSGMITRLDNGQLNFNPEELAHPRGDVQVYYAPEYSLHVMVVLSSDFKTNPNGRSVLLLPEPWNDQETKSVGEFLDENSISYVEMKRVYRAYVDEPLPSHDGHFFADGTRITTSDGEIVVQAQEYYGAINGWAYDDSGIFFQLPRVRGGPILMPLLSTGKARPILKLNVPPVHLQK